MALQKQMNICMFELTLIENFRQVAIHLHSVLAESGVCAVYGGYSLVVL